MLSKKAKTLDSKAAHRAASEVVQSLAGRLDEQHTSSYIDAMLSDLLPEQPNERRLMVAACGAGALRELHRAGAKKGRVAVAASLIRRIEAEHYAHEGAKFAVDVWAHALQQHPQPAAAGPAAIVNAAPRAAHRPFRPSRRKLVITVGVLVATCLGAIAFLAFSNYESPTASAPQAKPAAPSPVRIIGHAPARQVKPEPAPPELPPPEPIPMPVVEVDEWRLLSDASGKPYPVPEFRLTLSDLGRVLFAPPSETLFVLTSKQHPRPLPSGPKDPPKSTRRTLLHRGAKCHISHADFGQVHFAWFYRGGDWWVVDAYRLSSDKPRCRRCAFVYRYSDSTWWSLECEPERTQPIAIPTKADGMAKAFALARVRKLVTHLYLEDKGQSLVASMSEATDGFTHNLDTLTK